jgi:hypothetical protein
MKKRIITLTTFLILFVQSCNPSTAVRVLTLSYDAQKTTQTLYNPENKTNRMNDPKRVSLENSYIFPGDILTFTVELEDSNYEFISLLSVRFNGVTIRANSDDSIVTTRDCGANICVNFPFEAKSQVTEYVAEDVRFAKLGANGGVSAVIDNSSTNRVNINVWNSDESPYISQTVNLINQKIQSYDFLNLEQISNLTGNQWNQMIPSLSLSLVNPEDSPFYNPDLYTGVTQTLLSESYFGVDFSFTDFLLIDWRTNIEVPPTGFIKTAYVMIALITYNSANAFAYNEGNKIYLNYRGESYLIIELFGKMRLSDLVLELYQQ